MNLKNTSILIIMKYKYFDHTADCMFEAYGKTLPIAFSNATLAMFNLLVDINKVRYVEKFEIKIKANQLRKLLFDYLDELIFLMDTKYVLISKVEHMEIKEFNGEYELNCVVYGDFAKNYETHGDIKAPTYNQMLIKQENDIWTLRIVVDI